MFKITNDKQTCLNKRKVYIYIYLYYSFRSLSGTFPQSFVVRCLKYLMICARGGRVCERERRGQRLRLTQKKNRQKKRKSKLIHTSQFWQEEKNRSVYEASK